MRTAGRGVNILDRTTDRAIDFGRAAIARMAQTLRASSSGTNSGSSGGLGLISPCMKTVYIETTVVSYLAAWPNRDPVTAARQQATADWWNRVLPRLEGYVSPVVLDEIARGDADAIRRRQERISSLQVLAVTPEVDGLAEAYFAALPIPEKARADAYHLALATAHGMDYLVSWNLTHIVSGGIVRRLQELNAARGVRTPVICTPEQLMEPDYET